MAAAHSRDSTVKTLLDDAARALKALHDAPEAIGKLSLAERDQMLAVRRQLEKRSAHIVAVWD